MHTLSAKKTNGALAYLFSIETNGTFAFIYRLAYVMSTFETYINIRLVSACNLIKYNPFISFYYNHHHFSHFISIIIYRSSNSSNKYSIYFAFLPFSYQNHHDSSLFHRAIMFFLVTHKALSDLIKIY
jgi:hypothetical protein